MAITAVGESLRMRRLAAGLTQRELAARSDVPQPNIAAYETGRRRPNDETLARLNAAVSVPTFSTVRAVRSAIIAAGEMHRVSDIRVFGSVARGDAGPGSDLDLLVRAAPGASLFDLARFQLEVEQLVGVEVDVVSDRGTGPAMARIFAEAIVL